MLDKVDPVLFLSLFLGGIILVLFLLNRTKPSLEERQRRRDEHRAKTRGTPQPKSKRPGGKTAKKSNVDKFAGFDQEDIDGLGDDEEKLDSGSEVDSASGDESGSDSDSNYDAQGNKIKKTKAQILAKANKNKDESDKRKGTKWLAKQQAKEEKRLMLEQQKKERAEAKKQEEEEYQERKRLEREEEEKERKVEEERLKLLEAKRLKEEEEYNAMKADFEIEDEGEENTEEAMENEKEVLQRFISHIQTQKIVLLEELASTFNLKTQDCIDRINALLENESLTGVMDDRGKFIYVNQEELDRVAKFVKNKGRVSKGELSRESGKLIDLPKVDKS